MSQQHFGGDSLKRLFDVIISAGALVVFAPLFAVLALAIRLESRGPAVFYQTRIGRFGKPFTVLKFRTMAQDSDDAIHRQAIEKVWAGERISDDPDAPYKLTTDPRVTRVGKWLRKTSLDELPQLYNVLRGEMSIVGPRPMIPYEVGNFQKFHHERHQVLPGITGLAQVTNRGRASMEDMLRLDLEYVKLRSLRLDLKLVLQTFPMVWKGLGAR